MGKKKDSYSKAYEDWVAADNGRYTFTREKENPEHSYTAGQGYNRQSPDANEHRALYNCLSLLGVAMLVFMGFDVLTYVLLNMFMEKGRVFDVVYFSQRNDPITHSEHFLAGIFVLLTLAKYITICHIIKTSTQMPRAVVHGNPHHRSMVSFNSITIMMVVMVLGRISSTVVSRLLAKFGIDSIYCLMINDKSPVVSFLSVLVNCVIMPIMSELLFRGYVLQLFKQFGSAFAVLVSTLVCSLSYYDLNYSGYVFCCSIVLGVFTVSVGSLRLSMAMHLIANSLNYVLVLIGHMDRVVGGFVEMIVYFLIVCCALVFYFRFHSDDLWKSADIPTVSDIPLEKKMEIMLSSNSMALWFVLVLVTFLILGWLL